MDEVKSGGIFEFRQFVEERVTYKGGVDAIILVERFFEGKDDQHLVDVSFDFLDAMAFPGPHLRRDVVAHLHPLAVSKLGDTKVEARVIHKNHDIRLEAEQVGFAFLDVTKHFRKISDNFSEPHECHVPIVFHEGSPLFSHQIATPGPEFRLVVLSLQFGHQV